MGNEIPRRMLLLPIISKRLIEKERICIPRGIILISDKENNEEFDQKDVENLKMYSFLICKLIYVTSKLEYYESINEFVKKVNMKASNIEGSVDQNSYHLSKLKDNFDSISNTVSELKNCSNARK